MRQSTAAAAAHLAATLAVTAAAVLAAFALPVPAQAGTLVVVGDSGHFVDGSGREVAVARPAAAFTALRIDSSIDVRAHAGAAPAITVHADDNIEPLIETAVDGDTLVIRLQKGASFHTHRKIVVDVQFTALSMVQQRGSGDLHIDKVTGPRFESSIAGSGDLHIDAVQVGAFQLSIAGSGDAVIGGGSADEARFGIAGSGDIDARDFAVRKVSAVIRGSGDARVNATEQLDARVAGSGDVTYAGHPHDISRQVSGSGSVHAAR